MNKEKRNARTNCCNAVYTNAGMVYCSACGEDARFVKKMNTTKPSTEEEKHWWLKDRKFSRVRYVTLLRLGLLFQAEVVACRQVNSCNSFLLWLEDYLED